MYSADITLWEQHSARIWTRDLVSRCTYVCTYLCTSVTLRNVNHACGFQAGSRVLIATRTARDFQPWKFGDNHTELELPYMWSWRRVKVVNSLILQLHTPTHTALASMCTGRATHTLEVVQRTMWIHIPTTKYWRWPLTKSLSDKWDNFQVRQFPTSSIRRASSSSSEGACSWT